MTLALLALVVGFVAGISADVLRERRAAQLTIQALSVEMMAATERLRRIVRRDAWDEIAYDPLQRRAWDAWGLTAGSMLTRDELGLVALGYYMISWINGAALVDERRRAGTGSEGRSQYYSAAVRTIDEARDVLMLASGRKWWRPRTRRWARSSRDAIEEINAKYDMEADQRYGSRALHETASQAPQPAAGSDDG